MVYMRLPGGFGQQHLHWLPGELVSGVSEDLFCLGVNEDNPSPGFNNDHGIGGGFQKAVELFFAAQRRRFGRYLFGRLHERKLASGAFAGKYAGQLRGVPGRGALRQCRG